MELDQKKKVSNDRRDYILKLLPLIDAMRAATQDVPASTPRVEEMHESYQSLLSKMMELFERYGYKEFFPGEFPACMCRLCIVNSI